MKKYLVFIWALIGFIPTSNCQTQADARNLLIKMNETTNTAREWTSEMTMTIQGEEGVISSSDIIVVKKDNRLYTKNGPQESLADGDIRLVADHNSKTLVYSEIIHLGKGTDKHSSFDLTGFIRELDKNGYEYKNISRVNGVMSFEILMTGNGIFSSISLAINESTNLLEKVVYYYKDTSSVQRVEMIYKRNELKADEKLIPAVSNFIKGKGQQAVPQKEFASYRFINQANS